MFGFSYMNFLLNHMTCLNNTNDYCGGQLYSVLEPRWKRPNPTSDFIDMGCVKGCQAQRPT